MITKIQKKCKILGNHHSLKQPDLLKISGSILPYPLAECFEFSACLAGRCFSSQNINKYSNNPTKGQKSIIRRMTIWARGVINIFVIYPFLKHCATGKGFFCSIKTYFRQIISFSRYIYILILYPLQFFLGFSTKKLNHKKYFHTHTYFLTTNSQCYYMYTITHIVAKYYTARISSEKYFFPRI